MHAMVQLDCRSIQLFAYRQDFWLLGYARDTNQGPLAIREKLATPVSRAPDLTSRIHNVSLYCWLNGATEQNVLLHGKSHPPRIYPNIQKRGWSLGLHVQLESDEAMSLAQNIVCQARGWPIPITLIGNDQTGATRRPAC